MITKKLNTFEYAGKIHPGIHELEGLHRHEAFETPFGHVMVVAASEGMNEQQERLAGTLLERMKYYLEHAEDERVEDLPASALIYSSGYLYQRAKKNADDKASKLSCLCLIYQEEKVYYAWAGDKVCMSLWDGRRMHPLLGPKKADLARTAEPGNRFFMGQQADLEPERAAEPLVPVSGDILLLGSGAVCQMFQRREIRKILQDSMPLQTKLLRVMGQCGKEESHENASLMMMSFYHLKGGKRSFVAGSEKSRGSRETGKAEGVSGRGKVSGTKSSSLSSILKYAIIVLCGIVVGYMIYDLFIYDPRPPVRIPPPAATTDHDTVITPPEDAPHPVAEEPPAMPEDMNYTVRSGDTWSRIYRQFSVCSWFIINHPPNRGRFGREGSLIAGQTLRIPVRYSGDPELNPYYYTEFTTEKVGSRCENANEEFLDEFYEQYESVE